MYPASPWSGTGKQFDLCHIVLNISVCTEVCTSKSDSASNRARPVLVGVLPRRAPSPYVYKGTECEHSEHYENPYRRTMFEKTR
jgi:hypothetical protein